MGKVNKQITKIIMNDTLSSISCHFFLKKIKKAYQRERNKKINLTNKCPKTEKVSKCSVIKFPLDNESQAKKR
jgi:hypothetical protein